MTAAAAATSTTTSPSLESKGTGTTSGEATMRFRSPATTTTSSSSSSSQDKDNAAVAAAPGSPSLSDNPNINPVAISNNNSLARPGSADVLLQWGQKKRARVSRSEIRSSLASSSPAAAAAASASPSSSPSPAAAQEFSSSAAAAAAHQPLTRQSTMPPPPPPPPPSSSITATSATRLRKEKEASSNSSSSSAFLLHNQRNLEKRTGTGNGSPSRNCGGSNRVASRSMGRKRSPPTPEKIDRKIRFPGPMKDEKTNGSSLQVDRIDSSSARLEREARATGTAPVDAGGEKVNSDFISWPRIFISLSRKEKEEDFYAMKGTKLPHRPKKRAKNIDKALQYCFPGMWLSDLTKSRYEVREKKSTKKQQKRRGLKGMESVDSDSE